MIVAYLVGLSETYVWRDERGLLFGLAKGNKKILYLRNSVDRQTNTRMPTLGTTEAPISPLVVIPIIQLRPTSIGYTPKARNTRNLDRTRSCLDTGTSIGNDVVVIFIIILQL
jgi:hypothetical protein